jgi:hypothetical protein
MALDARNGLHMDEENLRYSEPKLITNRHHKYTLASEPTIGVNESLCWYILPVPIRACARIRMPLEHLVL